jgi:hypothetical protein
VAKTQQCVALVDQEPDILRFECEGPVIQGKGFLVPPEIGENVCLVIERHHVIRFQGERRIIEFDRLFVAAEVPQNVCLVVEGYIGEERVLGDQHQHAVKRLQRLLVPPEFCKGRPLPVHRVQVLGINSADVIIGGNRLFILPFLEKAVSLQNPVL